MVDWVWRCVDGLWRSRLQHGTGHRYSFAENVHTVLHQGMEWNKACTLGSASQGFDRYPAWMDLGLFEKVFPQAMRSGCHGKGGCSYSVDCVANVDTMNSAYSPLKLPSLSKQFGEGPCAISCFQLHSSTLEPA